MLVTLLYKKTLYSCVKKNNPNEIQNKIVINVVAMVTENALGLTLKSKFIIYQKKVQWRCIVKKC